ncbi:MAG TPA: TonB-dependent receptor, partial [Hymenobacter sp.]
MPAVHAQTPSDLGGVKPKPTATSAGLAGQVFSAQGVEQANAVVTILSLATSLRQTVVADQRGNFAMADLVPGGPYVVQVQQPGFRMQNITNVFLKAGEVTSLTVSLHPETVAVGTRRDDRTVLESAVPVDVVNIDDLVRTVPQTDLTQLLHYSVPAFNATRQVASGGADHVDLGNLRGLGTDQTLVLVNGKRRHTTALVNLLGNRGVGNVGTDINSLSSLGVERVEVLRDGAAAQYGSDAIAGVMNITLKSANRAGSVFASSGLTSEGDGLATLLGINKGFRLGQKGFLNLTVDADYRDRTTRGYARDPRVTPVFSDTLAVEQAKLAVSGKTYKDFTQRNGDARTYNARALINARVEKSDALAFYGFGSYNFRRGQAATPWVLAAKQPGDIVDKYFPNGYQPQVNTRIHDAAGTVGVVLGRSGSNRWTVDLSNTTGLNRMTYDLENTVNSSMGPLSPTVFDNAGGFQYVQNVSNVTVNRLFGNILAGTNVAFGGEVRAEQYEILEGQVETFTEYDDGRLNAQQGTQGFTGFGPRSAVLGNRTNVGTFLDVEADITKRWSVSGALRFENYSTFGSALIYKATTRMQATKVLAVRGAV